MAKTKIISIANSKGGVGKSTITMFLAVALAKDKGKRVLILDIDKQKTIVDYYDGEIENNDSLVTVEELTESRVNNFVNRWGGDYDYIFIDIPRITAKAAERNILNVLNCCDFVLVPVIGSQVDLLSTLDFIEILKTIKSERKADGFKFDCYGFINRHNRRKVNEEVTDFLKDSDFKMFDNYLSDIKLFSNPSLKHSILDSKEGKERFSAFYNEFIKKFKIK